MRKHPGTPLHGIASTGTGSDHLRMKQRANHDHMPPRTHRHEDFLALRELVASKASSQGNVFAPRDLEAWGIDPGICRTMVRRRLWIRLRQGVYADAAIVDTHQTPGQRHQLDLAGALHPLREPALAFGVSAAVLHDLPVPNALLRSAGIHLLRRVGTDHRVLGDRYVRSTGAPPVRITGHALDGLEMVTIANIPSVGQNVGALSASAAMPLDWAVAVLEASCFQDEGARTRLAELVEEWPLLLGIGMTRKAVPLVRTGAQSPLESISRVRLVKCGLPEPELQVPMCDDRGLIGYLDMWWPTLGVIGEADGAMKYEDRDVLLAEKHREDRLRALGFAVVRWTWAEILADPLRLARRIWAAARWARPGAALVAG